MAFGDDQGVGQSKCWRLRRLIQRKPAGRCNLENKKSKKYLGSFCRMGDLLLPRRIVWFKDRTRSICSILIHMVIFHIAPAKERIAKGDPNRTEVRKLVNSSAVSLHNQRLLMDWFEGRIQGFRLHI